MIPWVKLHSPNIHYLLTPWSRIILEKLTGSAASQEIPRIFGARNFITVLTSARHLSLPWANSIQFPQHPPTSRRSILILSSHLSLGLPNGLFPSSQEYAYRISLPWVISCCKVAIYLVFNPNSVELCALSVVACSYVGQLVLLFFFDWEHNHSNIHL